MAGPLSHVRVLDLSRIMAGPWAGQILADLVRIYGSGLDTSFDENPALIGGMRIRVGSDVYDDSVRARLASIEARL